MERMDIKKALLPAGLIILILVALFSPLNYFLSEQIVEEKGKFIQQRAYFLSGDEGTKGRISLLFELDSGELVTLRKNLLTKAVEPGDRVIIYSRKGAWFGNKIYERYEPVKSPQRYWTAEELGTVQ